MKTQLFNTHEVFHLCPYWFLLELSNNKEKMNKYPIKYITNRNNRVLQLISNKSHHMSFFPILGLKKMFLNLNLEFRWNDKHKCIIQYVTKIYEK